MLKNGKLHQHAKCAANVWNWRIPALARSILEVNLAFREALRQEIPQAEVVNDDNVGMATLFRIYLDGSPRFKEEVSGEATAMEIERNNDLNKILFEKLGEKRDEMFFGDTTKFYKSMPKKVKNSI